MVKAFQTLRQPTFKITDQYEYIFTVPLDRYHISSMIVTVLLPKPHSLCHFVPTDESRPLRYYFEMTTTFLSHLDALVPQPAN